MKAQSPLEKTPYCSGRTMGRGSQEIRRSFSARLLKGQSSIEFLVFASISIMFLVAAVTFFGVRSDEVTEMAKVSEMKGICHSVSTKLSAVFSAGSGAKTTLDLPGYVDGKDISVWIYANSNRVVVRDNETSVGCALNMGSVGDRTSGSFQIASNASLRNSNGVVVIE